MSESLKNKTVKGVGWSAADNVAQAGVAFIVTVVLARILSPDDYGLIGIIAIFTAICSVIINGGFTTALIRKKDATEDDYNTSFICNFVISIFLYLIIFFLAGFISDFFRRSELVCLIRITSLGLIIGSLSLVQQTRLTKKIDFKSQTQITIISSSISGLTGIFMAVCGCGVWALVAQQLSSQLIRTICLWCVNKWFPKLHFSSNSFHELFGFGWKMMLSNILDTVWTELNQAVVGRFYSPATLGQYTRAKDFSSLFSSNLTAVVQRVTFPVLSCIQDDKTRMVLAYKKIIRMSMFITTLGMFLLGAMSEPLLYCLIGEKWKEAATYLPIICIYGSTYPIQAINLNMLKVQGRSDLFLGLEIIKKIIALLPLFVGAVYGIMPMLYLNIITCIVSYFLNSYYSGALLGYSSWMQIKDIAPFYGLSLLVSIPVFLLKYVHYNYFLILFTQVLLSICLILIVCILFKIKEYYELKTIIISYINKLL